MSSAAERAVRSQQMSEWCERTSLRRSEWLITYVPVLGCSEPPCNMALFVGKMLFFEEVGSSSVELDPIGPSTLAIGSNSELFGSFLDMSPEGPGFGSISEFSGSSAFCGLS